MANTEQYIELKELTVHLLSHIEDELNLTDKEYEKLFKRITSNDMLLAQIFKIFSEYAHEEVLYIRERKTPRHKKFVDNILRGEGQFI